MGQAMLTLPEYMFSRLVYVGVHIVLLFLLWLCFTIISTLLCFSIWNCSCNRWNIQLILCATSYSFLQIGFILYYIQLLPSLKKKTYSCSSNLIKITPFTRSLYWHVAAWTTRGTPTHTNDLIPSNENGDCGTVIKVLLNCFARQSNNICPKR
jgi:hypothetical protein